MPYYEKMCMLQPDNLIPPVTTTEVIDKIPNGGGFTKTTCHLKKLSNQKINIL